MSQSVIHLLPDSVANQIAAGEVIQRPASVIKELMENSIDAGATEVAVAVQDAGRTQITVRDNGCGMSETDARLAFERHATSKISEATDLYHLSTMGFRGEALASIAAVAQVELSTCQTGEDIGVRLRLAASEVESQEPCSTPSGTRIAVRNLFFNLPARRRFLKSDAVEMRHICTEFVRVALAHPDISVSLTSDGQTVYRLPQGNVRQRVAGVAGNSLAGQLLPIEAEISLVKISGFVGTPETARKKNTDQYFFANSRYMRNPYFHKAIIEAYNGIISPDTTPAYMIYIEVDPQAIDVNVHPQKTEIKFEDEQSIWKVLKVAVSESLNKNNILPSIDFEADNTLDFSPRHATEADKAYNPFLQSATASASYAQHMRMQYNGSQGYTPSTPTDGWQQLYDSMVNVSTERNTFVESHVNSEHTLLTGSLETDACRFWQLANRYIFVAIEDGMLLIDQHRAHERILYDRYLHMLEGGHIESQLLLYPEVVNIGVADACIVSELTHELSQAGIEVSVDGGNVTIASTPAHMEPSDVRDFIECLAYDYQSGVVDIRSDIMKYMVFALAERSAIPYGKQLTTKEMIDLYQRLMECTENRLTPKGKTIFRNITTDELKQLLNT